jgi:hypothetical protein
MQLLESDESFLIEKKYDFELTDYSGLIIHDFSLPPHYSITSVDLLVIFPAGYPNANPDMFWTSPRVTLKNGATPTATGVDENRGGRTWQRWSRHWTTTWRPGIDGLRTFLAAVRQELDRGI